MLAVGCCGYDDPEGLERLIKSCWNHVDLFLYIDGAFSPDQQIMDMPTLKVIKKYPNVLNYYAWGLEHEKRQAYLDLAEQWDITWLIIADTDEYFYDCDWTAFTEERKQVCNDRDHLYNIKNYTEISYDGVTKQLVGLDQPRIIKNPGMLHYLNGHHYQLAINGTDEALTAKDTLYSIKLCHDPHLRTQERKDKHDEYIKWLRRYEAEKMMNETPKEKENRLVSVWSGN